MATDPLAAMFVLTSMGVVTRPGIGEALVFEEADGHIWGAVVGPREQDLAMRLLLSQRPNDG